MILSTLCYNNVQFIRKRFPAREPFGRHLNGLYFLPDNVVSISFMYNYYGNIPLSLFDFLETSFMVKQQRDREDLKR